MIYIETGSYQPAVNLAYEDYFLNGTDMQEDIFMLWQNEPVLVVGRFQNTLEEINSSFAETHQIQILRRISGGGAVYHDLGNLCFSFILHDVAPDIIDKSKYLRPLVDALANLGILAEVTKRNDLTIDGKKFCGNAMALHKNRLLFHGTLLFDTDLNMLDHVLKSSMNKIESKAVRSVRSTVTNLKDYLPLNIDINQFKQSIKQHLFSGSISKSYELNQEDFDGIQELVKQKYETWEWNFGRNPRSQFQRSFQFSGGTLEITIMLEKGCIKTCRFTSNFITPSELAEIEKRLINVRFTFTDILHVFNGFEITGRSGSIPIKDIVQTITM